MGLGKFFNAVAKAATTNPPQSKAKSSGESGKLAFQETGTPPITDKAGRVIVKLKSGSEVIIPVHTYKMTVEVGDKLAGKPKQDEEFDKSVKVRVSLISLDKGSEEVRVETTDGGLVGVVKRESAEFSANLFSQIADGLKGMASELAGKDLVFEVSANIVGEWQDDEDEAGEEIIYADYQEMNLKIKAPISAEVE